MVTAIRQHEIDRHLDGERLVMRIGARAMRRR